MFRHKDEPQPTNPPGCEELGQEVSLILWVNAQLSLLDRVRPSNRKDTLAKSLNETLTGSPAYMDVMRKASDLSKELESLKRAHQTEINSLHEEKIGLEQSLSRYHESDSPESNGPSRLKWLVGGVLVGVIGSFLLLLILNKQ